MPAAKDALADRVAAARERREAAAALRAQPTLGDAAADVDDAWAWVNKSRAIGVAPKTASTAAAAASAARFGARYDEQDAEAADYSAADLAGMRVHAGADDLQEGETLVFTLKDKRILDDDAGGEGEGAGEELENVRLAELRKGQRAREAARRRRPDEPEGDGFMVIPSGSGPGAASGKVANVLSKYDDVIGGEGGAARAGPVLVLGRDDAEMTGNAAEDAAASRSAAVKAKLAAAAAALTATDAGGVKTQNEFYTAQEMAAAAAPSAPGGAVKKMRKKKKPGADGNAAPMRRVHADELIPTEELLGGIPDGDDHGAQKATLDAEADAAWQRFQAAKAKAAAASAARIGQRAGASTGAGGAGHASIKGGRSALGDDDGDEEAADRHLEAALERSRRAAAAATAMTGGDGAGTSLQEARVAALAKAVTAQQQDGDRTGGGGAAWLEETAEFVRSISVERAAKRAQELNSGDVQDGIVGAIVIPPEPGVAVGLDADGDEDVGDAQMAEPEDEPHDGGAGMVAAAKRRIYRRPGDNKGPDESGGDGGGGGASADMMDPTTLLAPVQVPGAGGRAGASRGLGATLAMLKTTGALSEGVTWAGRNTDKAPQAVKVAVEAAGIKTADATGNWDFDFKLDRFDEFGRKMTPKEAFRELCHRFHGIFPSKSKQEARLKQWHEEQRQLKARDGDTPLAVAEHMRNATQRTATPFVVLSGSVKSSQVSDARGQYAVAADDVPQGGHQAGAATAGDARGAILQDQGLSAAALAAAHPGSLEGAAKVRFMLNIPATGGAGVKRPATQRAEGDGGGAKRPRTADE